MQGHICRSRLCSEEIERIKRIRIKRMGERLLGAGCLLLVARVLVVEFVVDFC
jgi:hypothetical protein